jgi:hypothetical protein
MPTLTELKTEAADRCGGADLKWTDSQFFGGSSSAKLDGRGEVSVMVDPPAGQPNIRFLDRHGKPFDIAPAVETAIVPVQEDAPVAFSHIQVDDVGVVSIDKEATFETLLSDVGAGFRLYKALPPIIADLLNYMEAKWGERMPQAFAVAQALNISPDTVLQWKSVYGRVPREQRRPEIPFSLYRATVQHGPEAVTMAMDLYEELGTVEDAVTATQETVHQEKVAKGEVEPVQVQDRPPCPLCGGQLGARKCQACGSDFSDLAWYVSDLLGEVTALLLNPAVSTIIEQEHYKQLGALASSMERNAK